MKLTYKCAAIYLFTYRDFCGEDAVRRRDQEPADTRGDRPHRRADEEDELCGDKRGDGGELGGGRQWRHCQPHLGHGQQAQPQKVPLRLRWPLL